MIEHIKIPEEAKRIIDVLNSKGYDAYVVGGCVRDCILERAPKDWDITTSAKPEEVKVHFEKTIDTGIKHGTVTILVDQVPYEVTTYRIDGEYSDNRHPSQVEFTSSLEADLARRDFTINAIAYHPIKGFVDPFGGIRDIEKGIIRAVGDADERFSEDALRMLRCIRFSAQLGFEIENKTYASIKNKSRLIKNISAERIRDELTKILSSKEPAKFSLLHETGLLAYIMPEFEPCFETPQNHPYHIYDVAKHIFKALENIEDDIALRWTMLLHDIGKPYRKTTDAKGIDHFYGHPEKSRKLAETILSRLRFDNKSIKKICELVAQHDREIKPDSRSVRKALNSIGEELFPELLKVQEADKKAQNLSMSRKRLAELEKIRGIYYNIKEEKQCISLKDLAINGSDLIAAGFEPGKKIGILLKRIMNDVLENPELNTKDKLLALAGKIDCDK